MARIELNNNFLCSGCGACVQKCPKDCLKMSKDELGFNRPELIFPDSCVKCGLCLNVCPQQNHLEKDYKIGVDILYGQSKNVQHLQQSSSGGFFSVVAEYVLGKGGCIWGVRSNSNGLMEFACVEKKEDLFFVRGSKYVEVNTCLDYKLVESQVKSGRLVVVCGTPCQVRAVRNYLGKSEYDNLLLIDLLCYGIQSPWMWMEYLQEVNANKKSIYKINMRCKKKSWYDYGMEIEYNDKSLFFRDRWHDSWLLTYSKSVYNRESCSVCKSKLFPRASDVTMGDFWHYKKYNEKLNFDEKAGISVIVLNSKKGRSFFDCVKESFTHDKIVDEHFKEYLLESYSYSVPISKLRNAFYENVKKRGFALTTKKYFGSGLMYRCKKMIREFLKSRLSKLKRLVKK